MLFAFLRRSHYLSHCDLAVVSAVVLGLPLGSRRELQISRVVLVVYKLFDARFQSVFHPVFVEFIPLEPISPRRT